MIKATTKINKFGKEITFCSNNEEDYIFKSISNSKDFYERDLLNWIASIPITKGTFIDVGANIGNHSIFFASILNRNCISFEPEENTFNTLLDNIEANNLKRKIHALNIAAGSKKSSASIDIAPDNNSGATSIKKDKNGRIDIDSIDNIVKKNEKISLIKIDVEGFEFEVLKGAKKTIKKNKPLILIECFDEIAINKTISYFNHLNYQPISIFGNTPMLVFSHKSKLKKYFGSKNIDFFSKLKSYLFDRKQLKSCNEKYREITGNLNDARLKYSNSTKLIENLKSENKILLKNFEESQKTTQNYSGQIITLQSSNLTLSNNFEDLNDKFKSLNKINSLNLSIVTTLEKNKSSLTSKLEAFKNNNYDNFKKRVEFYSELQKSKEEFKTLSNNFEKLNKTNLINESRTIPLLKDELKRVNFQLSQAINSSKAQEVESNRKLRLASSKNEQIKQTLSFQVGHKLVHAFKPWYNIFFLPFELIKAKKEFNKRQALKKKEPIANNSKLNLENLILDKKKHQSKASKELSFDKINFPNKNKKIKLDIENISNLKMACVMDEFTYNSFKPECNLKQISVDKWKEDLETFQPEVLFIESAWRGKDDKWNSKIGHNSIELQSIVKWCSDRNIPTLFWNKEDPIHFETFLNTAKQFDFIFTTDIDCIQKYKKQLKHDNIYLLPFATQPQQHNPIEKFERKDMLCFAGAYYTKYPDRTKDLGNFVTELTNFKNLEIYDRNYGKDNPDYMFPDEYKPFIVGTLKHTEIDKAYKGYNYAINLNSIKQSQTMFARRVFELLSSNTTTISNFSKGTRLMFGNLVFTSDSGQEILHRLEDCSKEKYYMEKIRLLGLRKVLQEHTYSQRMLYIASKINKTDFIENTPSIANISFIDNLEDFDYIKNIFNNFNYSNKHLYILTKNKSLLNHTDFPNISILKPNKLKDVIKEEWVSLLDKKDFYCENYLTDLILATKYSSKYIIGKESLDKKELFYRYSDHLKPRQCIFKKDMLKDYNINDLETLSFEFDGLVIDPFNYSMNGRQYSEEEEFIKTISDIKDFNCGISINTLLKQAENIEPELSDDDNLLKIEPSKISTMFKNTDKVAFSFDNNKLTITSELEDETHQYIYSNTRFTLEELKWNKIANAYLETSPGLKLMLLINFLDSNNQKISHEMLIANKNHEFSIPEGTTEVSFALRIYSYGTSSINSIYLDYIKPNSQSLITNSDTLLLTNNYPTYNNIYKNGFVHSRVKEYHKQNIKCDVFRLVEEELSYHEFQNIDVFNGNKSTLHKLISDNKYKRIFVHFLDENMWEVLKDFNKDIEIFIWVHGAEIQPWWRRKFLYSNDIEINDAMKKSFKREHFWNSIFKNLSEKTKFIFVSNSFANEVMKDYNFNIPTKQYSIIHNTIDTDIFNFIPKDEEQRKFILSIRPYATNTYANDLSVKAVLELSKKSWFKDLEFKFIGDGILFEETLEPLRKFDNVSIEQRFLTRQEITNLHKNYGIFLVPSRMDTQGVSRDEAMSSGLVPITNNIAAIPEFVDSNCGILVEGEDHFGLAQGIEKLYHNPKLFTTLSNNAASRVRSQSSVELTTDKEIEFISK